MTYKSYYPGFLEDWHAEKYQDVIRYLSWQDRSAIVIFCVDLYHYGKGLDDTSNGVKNLVLFAAECAKFENYVVDSEELKTWTNNIVAKWEAATGSNLSSEINNAEIDEISAILISVPFCKLVTFVNSILLKYEYFEGLFYLGYLSGSLGKVWERLKYEAKTETA
jgi:hypothetical protein